MQILLLRGGSSTRVKTSTFRVENKRPGFSCDVGPHSGFNRRTFESMNHFAPRPCQEESGRHLFVFVRAENQSSSASQYRASSHASPSLANFLISHAYAQRGGSRQLRCCKKLGSLDQSSIHPLIFLQT